MSLFCSFYTHASNNPVTYYHNYNLQCEFIQQSTFDVLQFYNWNSRTLTDTASAILYDYSPIGGNDSAVTRTDSTGHSWRRATARFNNRSNGVNRATRSEQQQATAANGTAGSIFSEDNNNRVGGHSVEVKNLVPGGTETRNTEPNNNSTVDNENNISRTSGVMIGKPNLFFNIVKRNTHDLIQHNRNVDSFLTRTHEVRTNDPSKTETNVMINDHKLDRTFSKLSSVTSGSGGGVANSGVLVVDSGGKGDGNGGKANGIGGTELSARLVSLLPASEYSVVVSAATGVGVGVPSPSTRCTTLQDGE